MLFRIHFFPGVCLLALGLALQFVIAKRLYNHHSRRLVVGGTALGFAILLLGYFLEFYQVSRFFPVLWTTWLQCAALVELVGLVAFSSAALFWWRTPPVEPQRRIFLQAAGSSLCVVPGVAAVFGIVGRNRFQLNQVKLPVPNLPKDLEGLRLVQITDVHLSPFMSEQEFARAVDMANETKAHLAVMTGDLISRRGDPLDACLRQLGRLRAEAGVIGCLGNHEVYSGTESYVTEQGSRLGIEFLRHQAKTFRFGRSTINFAGVDYQRFRFPYLVGAEKLVRPGMLNFLLSHNPDVFPLAASKGFDVTISGHTHGGQVDFEILHQHLNVARVYTPYVRGSYTQGNASLFVSAGLGTIGVPVRLGVAPEVSLIQLCAISS